jgi:hypothetical protein
MTCESSSTKVNSDSFTGLGDFATLAISKSKPIAGQSQGDTLTMGICKASTSSSVRSQSTWYGTRLVWSICLANSSISFMVRPSSNQETRLYDTALYTSRVAPTLERSVQYDSDMRNLMPESKMP